MAIFNSYVKLPEGITSAHEKPYISEVTLSSQIHSWLLGDRPANGCQELKIIV